MVFTRLLSPSGVTVSRARIRLTTRETVSTYILVETGLTIKGLERLSLHPKDRGVWVRVLSKPFPIRPSSWLTSDVVPVPISPKFPCVVYGTYKYYVGGTRSVECA